MKAKFLSVAAVLLVAAMSWSAIVHGQKSTDTSASAQTNQDSVQRGAELQFGAYSASSGSINPSIRFTSRTPADALDTLAAESNIIAGTGSQLRTLNRWGDYSALTVDPVDDCTFWFTTEYLKTNGTFNWSTRIASFKLPSCQ